MKKKMSLILAVVMLAVCSAALAVSPTEILGEWYGIKGVTRATSLNPSKETPLDDVTLVFNRDKTAVLTIGDKTLEYKWALTDGELRFDYGSGFSSDLEIKDTLSYADGVLVIEFHMLTDVRYSKIEFAREKVSALPEVKAAASEEEFYGRYTLEQVFKDGLTIDPAELLMTASVDAEVSFAQADLTFTGGFTSSCLTDFADGKLIVYYDANGVTLTLDVSLTVDGRLLAHTAVPGEGVFAATSEYLILMKPAE